MDFDKLLNEMSDPEGGSDRFEQAVGEIGKTPRVSNFLNKEELNSLISAMPEKVGKDVKARLSTMGGRLTLEQLLKACIDIMTSGNMTQMVMLKDVPSLSNKPRE